MESSGLSWSILRPASFFQNFGNFFSASIKKDGAFYMPQGDSKVSYIDAEDIGSVAATILLSPAGHEGKVCWRAMSL